MFNNNFEFKVLNTITDDNGKFVALSVNIDEFRYTIISTYGPNHDCPEFFQNITDAIEKV